MISLRKSLSCGIAFTRTFLQLVVTRRHVSEMVLHVVVPRVAHQLGSGDEVCVCVDVCQLLLTQHILSLEVCHVLVRLGAQMRAVTWARHAAGVVTAAEQLSQGKRIPRNKGMHNRLLYKPWLNLVYAVQGKPSKGIPQKLCPRKIKWLYGQCFP